MGRYVTRRVLQTVVVLWAAATLFFIAARILPGDPIRAMFGFVPPPQEVLDRLYHRFGLDRPLYVQYLDYLWDLLHGRFGRSYDTYREVRPRIFAASTTTLKLLVVAAVGQTVLGLTAGVSMRHARRPGQRRATRLAVLLAASVPMLVVAYVVRVFLTDSWQWVPEVPDPRDWTTYVVPGAVLAVVYAAYVALVADESLQRTLNSEFVLAARARGFTRRRVLWRHGVRASLTPVITLVGTNMAQVVTALLIVETVFEVQGLGLLTYRAIRARDHVLIVGVGIVVTLMVVIINLITDLLAAWSDPRIRLE
jgi:oligopeptide transport system permease protein